MRGGACRSLVRWLALFAGGAYIPGVAALATQNRIGDAVDLRQHGAGLLGDALAETQVSRPVASYCGVFLNVRRAREPPCNNKT